MPPKTRVTKEMIINAAFEIARESGFENINARTVSDKLSCSTQPIMYNFGTIENLKQAVYAKVDSFHAEYLMQMQNEQNSMPLEIGLNYIRFAIYETNLFHFLFQSGYAVESSVMYMVNSDELKSVIEAMHEAIGMSLSQTKEIFLMVALFTHGYAIIIANNALKYDEELIAKYLERAFNGAYLSIKEEQQ